MSDGGLELIKPGILTLVQDLGRQHYQHLGLASGGAADEQAFLWANRLLENPANSPALEICFGGLTLLARQPCQIAITGADCNARINQQPAANWQSHFLQQDDLLSFGNPHTGVRSYLAVKGGLSITPTLGSTATLLREKIGGLDGMGSPLQRGDVLPCPISHKTLNRQLLPVFIPDYQAPVVLRMIENRKLKSFSAEAFIDLYASKLHISAQSNQMGVRLEGSTIQPAQSGIISEGMPFGAIQIPPDGQPIVLLKDRQTIGGYPVIGNVLATDAFLLSQQQANSPVNFAPISLAEAQQIMRRFYQFFR